MTTRNLTEKYAEAYAAVSKRRPALPPATTLAALQSQPDRPGGAASGYDVTPLTAPPPRYVSLADDISREADNIQRKSEWGVAGGSARVACVALVVVSARVWCRRGRVGCLYPRTAGACAQ
jgi:hypothetical protein